MLHPKASLRAEEMMNHTASITSTAAKTQRHGCRRGRASILGGGVEDAGEEELVIDRPFINHGVVDEAFVNTPLSKNLCIDASIDKVLECRGYGRT